MSQQLITAAAIVPSNQTDKDKIFNAIKEIDASLVRIDSEKDLIKDIAEALKDEFGMERRLVNSLAKTYHQGNRSDVDTFHDEFTDFYDNVIK